MKMSNKEIALIGQIVSLILAIYLVLKVLGVT